MKNPPQVAINLRPAQLIKWHRRIGMAAALFVLVLALSGIALNHTTELELGKRHIDSKLLLSWYGVELPDQPRHYHAGDTIISQLGDQLFIDGIPVIQNTASFQGGAATPMFIAIALQRELLLLTPTGELVERINNLPANIGAIEIIGVTAEQNVAISDGETTLIADANLLSWQTAHRDEDIDWSTTAAPGKSFDDSLMQHYRNHEITYERVMLDLHSGRLLGSWGIYLMDTAALLLIVLALTGFWRWRQRLRKP